MKYKWKVNMQYLWKVFFDFLTQQIVFHPGFQWLHGGKVLTIFSAPNYCGEYGNRAALARFLGQGGGPQIVQFNEHWEKRMAEQLSYGKENFPGKSCLSFFSSSNYRLLTIKLVSVQNNNDDNAAWIVLWRILWLDIIDLIFERLDIIVII